MVAKSVLSQRLESCSLMATSETQNLEIKFGVPQSKVFHSDDIIINGRSVNCNLETISEFA
jgi:pyrimidine operon attenuation protein/uracil phosphoribosyltransferase